MRVSARIYIVLLGANWLAAAAWAQSTAPQQPYYDPSAPPAWVTPAPTAPGFVPNPQDPTQPFPPPTAVPPAVGNPNGGTGFDYFEDEDDFYDPGYDSSAGGGGGKHEVKDSFKLVERPTAPVCKRWGSSFLGPIRFPDLSTCEFELEQKIDRGSASIDTLYDRVEFYKLKKVIQGDLKDRQEAAKYDIRFDALRSSLREAARSGCTCKER
ncbi:MAG TPA: hypothetical protein VI895_02180 [Bdellovibrionota bacterium]|nr:hypothetical protein [Bdellovibrionota bacterium]